MGGTNMKKLILGAVSALLLAAPALAQDAVLGTWKTQADDNGAFGHVRMYQCETAICGQLIRAFDGSGQQIDSENVGKRIIWDMQPAGEGSYGKGKIYAPDRGKTYSSKMQLQGDVLSVSGCVIGICRAQRWTRLDG
jgi:uncharacterized protein (DUF2147 family)